MEKWTAKMLMNPSAYGKMWVNFKGLDLVRLGTGLMWNCPLTPSWGRQPFDDEQLRCPFKHWPYT